MFQKFEIYLMYTLALCNLFLKLFWNFFLVKDLAAELSTGIGYQKN